MESNRFLYSNDNPPAPARSYGNIPLKSNPTYGPITRKEYEEMNTPMYGPMTKQEYQEYQEKNPMYGPMTRQEYQQMSEKNGDEPMYGPMTQQQYQQSLDKAQTTRVDLPNTVLATIKPKISMQTPPSANKNNWNEMQTAAPSSNKISVFAGRSGNFNSEFYNRLLRQFDRTFLSKLVDLHNQLGKQKLNLNEIDNIIEFLIHYKKELTNNYLYSLLFPERSKGTRIPTKFPIPSMTFQQKSNLTINPNVSNNWYFQWCPQTLLSTAFVTANNGNCLLNNSAAITGSVADTTAANYTAITVDRLQNAGMIQAYRLVSASLIISYVGSVDAHSGVIGGGVDVSFVDSTLPDTASSVFSTIDDKIWNLQTNPYEGLRLIYFPKDYSDLNFIRTDVSTATNGIPTCIRFLLYGQNMPIGASVRIDLYRNFEAIPFPGMSDFVTVDFFKPKNSNPNSQGEPAIDAGSKIAESGVTVTKLSDEKALEDYALSGGSYGFKDTNDDIGENAFEDVAMGRKDSGFFGSLFDIAGGLGKTLIGGMVNNTIGNIPFIGGGIASGINSGLDFFGNKISNIFN